MTSDKCRLIHWLKTLSIKSGEEFLLASCKTSNVYIDVKKMAMSAKANKLLANLLCAQIIETFGEHGIDVLAGVELGGCHLASSVSIAHPLDLSVIYVRKEIKDHGSRRLIDGEYMIGQKVVLLEDVLTTGRSAVKAAKILVESGMNVAGILAVVDRRENRLSDYLDNFKVYSLVSYDELI